MVCGTRQHGNFSYSRNHTVLSPIHTYTHPHTQGVWHEGADKRVRSAMVGSNLGRKDLLPWAMQACSLGDTYAVGRAKAYRLLCKVWGVHTAPNTPQSICMFKRAHTKHGGLGGHTLGSGGSKRISCCVRYGGAQMPKHTAIYRQVRARGHIHKTWRFWKAHTGLLAHTHAHTHIQQPHCISVPALKARWTRPAHTNGAASFSGIYTFTRPPTLTHMRSRPMKAAANDASILGATGYGHLASLLLACAISTRSFPSKLMDTQNSQTRRTPTPTLTHAEHPLLFTHTRAYTLSRPMKTAANDAPVLGAT